jgi:hypothetical protein
MGSGAPSGKSAGKIVLIALGALALIVGLVLALGGGVVLVAQNAFRDSQGFFVSGTHPFASSGYAITSNHIDLGANPQDRASRIGGIFTLRLRVESTNGRPIFVGIAPSADVDSYLGTVDHDEVTDVSLRPFRATYKHVNGTPAPRLPESEPIWVANASGLGRQTLIWHPRGGHWTVVVMEENGARPVAADMSVGVRVRYLTWIGVGLLIAALLAFAAGALMLYFGVRVPRRVAEPPIAAAVTA